jgi:hypothetical protein
MTTNITISANLTAAATQIDDLLSRPQCEEVYHEEREDAIHTREMAEYEARMHEADECDSPRYEDPVDLYGGDDYSNEYMEGDQGEW